MNQKAFGELVSDSSLLNTDTLSDLEQLLKEYPFCQTVHLLYTKNLYQEKHIRYHQHLKIAAAIACDRRRLKHYIEDSAIAINRAPEQSFAPPAQLAESGEKRENQIVAPSEQTVFTKNIQDSEDQNVELPDQTVGDLTSGPNPDVNIQQQADADLEADYESVLSVTLDTEISREEKKKAIIAMINKKFVDRVDPNGDKRPEIMATANLETVISHDHQSEIESDIIDESVDQQLNAIDPSEEGGLHSKATVESAMPPVDVDEKWIENEKGSKNESHTSIDEQPSSPAQIEVTSSKVLIDRFLRNKPRISRPTKEFFNPVNLAARSSEENEDFYTETYASISLKQGNVAKAIKIYQKLSLKLPEKSSYFAGLIEKIKKEQNI